MPPVRRSKRDQDKKPVDFNKISTSTPGPQHSVNNTQSESSSPFPTVSPPKHDINATSTTFQINAYLKSIDLPGWYIHPSVIAFKDEAHKTNTIQRNTSMFIKAGVPEDYISAYKTNLEQCHLITTAFRFIKTSGTILWMSGSTWQPGPASEPSFHSFLLIFKNRKVAIVDPGYIIIDEARLRLTSLGAGLELARMLLKKMKGSRKVVEMWVGKGVGDGVEYSGVNCNDLVFLYLQQFVTEGGKWDARDWEAEGFNRVFR
ncbi:hypothetical protein EDC01DRAFT_626537 [Geopyxis carbonaria]|nr:hypothetical protein EDC01DRAFT_626537 [Geopyxis carbonaria]